MTEGNWYESNSGSEVVKVFGVKEDGFMVESLTGDRYMLDKAVSDRYVARQPPTIQEKGAARFGHNWLVMNTTINDWAYSNDINLTADQGGKLAFQILSRTQ